MNTFNKSISSATHSAVRILFRRDVVLFGAAATLAIGMGALNHNAPTEQPSFAATTLPTSSAAAASPSQDIAKTLMAHDGAYESGKLAGANPAKEPVNTAEEAADPAHTASAEDTPAPPAAATSPIKTGA